MLETQSEMQTGLEMIKLGYDGEHNDYKTRHLNFIIGFDLNSACAAVDIIDQYNSFDAESVKSALRKIAKKISTYSTFYVGRESSPVIYIYDFSMNKEAIEDIKAHLRAAYADEVDEVEKGRKIRAWWD